jgi:uncharacterized alkaline shock family protein YloU
MATKHLPEDVADYDPLDLAASDDMRLDPKGNSAGDVQITDGVIVAIVRRAVGGVKGAELAGSGGNWFGSSKAGKDVTVAVSEDLSSCEIELQVKMLYDTPLHEVAAALQSHVKEVVERMTGNRVSAVKVKIVGLIDPKESDRA